MNDHDEKKKGGRKSRTQVWLTVGVMILIVLLFFWADIADMLGWGAD